MAESPANRFALPGDPETKPTSSLFRTNKHFYTCSCSECRDVTLDGLPGWARKIYKQAQRNAGRRGIEFTLTGAEYKQIVEEAKECCMVSGIPFQHEGNNGKRRPFAPSLDRVKSDKGYSLENCRIVCVIANLAMNEWGLAPLLKLSEAMAGLTKHDPAWWARV